MDSRAVILFRLPKDNNGFMHIAIHLMLYHYSVWYNSLIDVYFF